ncbi:P-loop containing nucleoside triphosphate hydrolase protein [Mycena rosella]|uniref:P-loop containing nucleoside triphosphate hydrolase protein n=1 Tax=Mycena rosella TaxID=1033263 RepID=A0AAD7GYQ1_MYCRO|nr:P-loop containing nucleoside triphosphate hydrolase protein [Mycena rosella]
MARTSTSSTQDSDDATVAHAKGDATGAPPTTMAAPKRDLQLDGGEERVRFRQRWWQLWVPANRPPPPRTSLDDAELSPYVTASLLSRLTYTWITPMMVLGYQRTLQAADLWKMGPEQEAGFLTDALDAAWAQRVAAAAEWNARVDRGEARAGLLRRAGWALPGRDRAALEGAWRKEAGRREASLAWALNDVLGHLFWRGGVFKVVSDTSQLMGPLLVKALINFSKARAAAKAAGAAPASIGNGVGMAVGLFCVIVLASICQHQFFFRSMTTGVLARTALTGALYRRAVGLTPKARTRLSNSAVLNHVSTDVSRVDACAQWFHAAWTAPIQVTVCLIILLVELGPAALAGFALFLLVIPIQERMMARQFALRRGSMRWTDARARAVLEVLGAMRVVKYFCYEGSFLARIFDIRKSELKGIRWIQHSQSANIAMAFSLPVLAATLAFVTYTETSKQFDVAIVFASFSLFQLLRQPMMFLPRALSAIADARNALARLTAVFHAETREGDAFVIDAALGARGLAVEVEGAEWVWEEGAPADEGKEKDGKGGKKGKENARETEKNKEKEDENDNENEKEEEKAEPFAVRDITLAIPRGTLAAVVGRVGSGKSSLLQGLIGEMRLARGRWAFGGRVAYCPQSAWIQNATLRDNVLFGLPFEEEKYWRVMEDACLLPDLQLLADGDLTEVGEKGINLSGGQKQRVNIARALYYGADVVIFDDPLSAVDANVGKALFHSAIQGLVARGKTVLLVTHALHFLAQCDYIYTLDRGRIAEAGTYAELIAKGGEFARLDREFGGAEAEEAAEEGAGEGGGAQVQVVSVADAKAKSAGAEGTGKIEGRLIVKEHRTTGGVAWSVYGYYLKAGGGWITVPWIVLTTVLMQGSSVANSYTLVWWQDNAFNKSTTFYQVLYALLGIAQAIFTYLLGILMDIFAVQVSRNLHHDAIVNVFHAPMSFFDTIPMGRIIGIFGKDIDTIDNQLPMSMRMFILVLAGVFGSVIVITILEHYFIVAAFVITLGFGYFAAFYRASALEMKRLDALLRSILYAHLSESLTGAYYFRLPTIRSYGEIPRFIRDNKYYIDLENRALFLTVTNQRWLAVRLDGLGSILVFLIAIFAAVGVNGISPAEIGLILTYTTSLTQMFAVTTRLSAEVENYMNSVERVVHYARGDAVPQEAAHESEPQHKPAAEWPARGAVEFKNVTMAYRPGLPNVLHGISLKIKAGEKIGVVGRTGAGKSSLTLCLLRIVEYSGEIVVDDVDIGKIGLTDLRSNIAIIPQEPTLFSGTVRTALDPFSKYDDARLWDALRRSYLVETRPSTPTDGDLSPENRHRLNLDTVIETDGANLSVGERSLLSLARALVKDCRVVILDEATASVDLETDNKIQRTIQTQFKDRTLICIAHRLRTIISYDRILVLDAGKIAEFDTPLNLFNQAEGVFRGLCEKSNITLTDIEKAVVYDDME